MQPTEPKSNRKRLIIFALVALIVITFLAILGRREKIDTPPEEGTAADYTTQARVIGGEELFVELEGDARYDSFIEDLFVFGEKNYEEYKNSDKVIGFKLDDKPKREGEELVFTGKYGSSGNTISIRLQKLPNSRLKTQITDTKSGVNIDAELPSNSPRNQYIATLPVQSATYAISYHLAQDSFIIDLYDGSTASRTAAEAALAAGLKQPDLSKETVRIVKPTSGGEGEGTLLQ